MSPDLVPALEAALEAAKDALGEKEAVLAMYAAEADDLRIEVQGLQQAVARHKQTSSPSPSLGSSRDWVRLSRTDAILKALEELTDNEAASPSGLAERLALVGRTDDAHALGAALSYLQRKGEVRNVGRGQWVLAQAELGRLGSIFKGTEYTGNGHSQLLKNDGGTAHALTGAPSG
jgi:hypothetical protein